MDRPNIISAMRATMAWSISLMLLALVCVCGVESAQQKVINYQYRDEIHANTVFGNIVRDAGLQGTYDQRLLDTFQFDLLNGNGNLREYFRVEQHSGDLITTRNVDRDVMCPGAVDCDVLLDVAIVRPLENFEVFKVVVTLEDVNDNSPVFAQSSMTIRVSESAAPGVSFVLPSAQDLDGGAFGVQKYEVRGAGAAFAIEQLENLDGSKDWRLRLRRRLNREHQDAYSLQIVAQDGGQPPRSGTMTVEVVVVDANDNSPAFDRNLYNVSVSEDAQPGSDVVAAVHATDPDEGINGQVVYSFAQQTLAAYGHLFDIHNRSGEIVLKSALDYEQQQTYHLLVTASDLGPDSVPAHAKVIIHVDDVNDFAPRVSVNSWSSTGVVEVAENKPPGEFVAHVAVEDLDKGPSGVVTCTIPDPEFELHQMYPGAYKVLTETVFDREAKDAHTFSIECQDQGEIPLRTTQSVSVHILDVNDHDPEFEQREYSVSIPETTKTRTPILQVNATDRDVGANAEITYHLHANPKSSVGLRVDPHTGVITTKNRFDHETQQDFECLVLAIDHGDPPRTTTATVHLSIEDVNDVAPIFSQASYNFGSFENQLPHTEIGTVSATDPDSSPFDQFVFSLKEVDGGSSSSFEIDADSGKITTLKMLDREHHSAYYLVAIATDTSSPNPASSASVTVYVADRNDNAPRIDYPSKGNDTLELSVYSPVGYEFGTVAASDYDIGNNARLHYSIAKGNEEDLFEVNSVTGTLSVGRSLADAELSSYQLTIMVKDSGEREQSSWSTLTVELNGTEAFARSQDLSVVQPTEQPIGLGRHQQILIILGAITAVLVAILITAIICIKGRQSRGTERDSYKYMCRVDLANMMQTTGGKTKVKAKAKVKNNCGNGTSSKASLVGLPYEAVHDGSGADFSPSHLLRHGSVSSNDDLSVCSQTKLQNNLDQPPEAEVPNCPIHSNDVQLTKEQMEQSKCRDSDSTSGCSADMSNHSDSGRGPSDEGDHGNAVHNKSRDRPKFVSNADIQNTKSLPHRPSQPKVACPLKCGTPHIPPRSPFNTEPAPSKNKRRLRGNNDRPGNPGREPSHQSSPHIWQLRQMNCDNSTYSHQPVTMTTFGYESPSQMQHYNIPPDSTYIPMDDVAIEAVDV